jgi:hypothetical protein
MMNYNMQSISASSLASKWHKIRLFILINAYRYGELEQAMIEYRRGNHHPTVVRSRRRSHGKVLP